MIVLTTTPPETVQTARQKLRDVLSSDRIVMVVRRNDPVIAAFAANADERAAGQDWRVVVWVRDSAIFAPGQEAEIYAGQDDCCGAAWSAGATRDTLQATALPIEIEKAFLRAEAV